MCNLVQKISPFTDDNNQPLFPLYLKRVGYFSVDPFIYVGLVPAFYVPRADERIGKPDEYAKYWPY